MPLSAYLGRADLLDSTRGLGITSTYGGEALSLAAARAAIRFYAEHGVIAHLWRVGRRFLEGVNRLFEKHAFPAALRGLPVCPVFVFQGEGKAGEFFRSCYAHGVSLYDAPFVNYSHKEADIDEALERMEEGVRKL
jgi:glutamate-1-semialdehyde 2,1-aminomutase